MSPKSATARIACAGLAWRTDARHASRIGRLVHPGEECVTIVQGRLHVCVNGVGYDLEEGDSLTYDSSLPHWYRNPTTKDAVLIGAMTPPSF